MYSSKRARSADGNGAGIRHPPGYLESRQQQFGNPKRFKIRDRRFNVPLHKIKRLRRHGERYFADALRDLSDDRRYAIMGVCALEWQAAISDAIVETHDRIVGRTWREAKRLADARIDDAQASIRDTLLSFKDMGTSLLAAHGDNQPLEPVIQWPELESLVAVAGKLTSTMAADPIAHVTGGWGRFRRYAPRMLRVLEIEAAPVCAHLLKTAHLIRDKTAGHDQPKGFLRKTSKWHRHLKADDIKMWEVAVFFHLRDSFRSGDIWLAHSERFGDQSKSLVPASALPTNTRLAVPLNVDAWLTQKKQEMAETLKTLEPESKVLRCMAMPCQSACQEADTGNERPGC